MNNLDSDEARHVVGPNLGPNCLQRLSADGKSFVSRKEKDKQVWTLSLDSSSCVQCLQFQKEI